MASSIHRAPASVCPPPAPESFADIARRYRRGLDYDVVLEARAHSSVAVVAPHGGGIERGTSGVARALAGDDFNLYLFEGRLPALNYESLHLTSHRFDEPDCLALIARCDHVLTVHGCNHLDPDPGVLLGGLDADLKARLAAALCAAGVPVRTEGHPFPATRASNVCNRGRRGAGVQVELTGRLRGGPDEGVFVAAVRSVLQSLPG